MRVVCGAVLTKDVPKNWQGHHVSGTPVTFQDLMGEVRLFLSAPELEHSMKNAK
jgi:hypothetical protein